jgi:hypothetical protein
VEAGWGREGLFWGGGRGGCGEGCGEGRRAEGTVAAGGHRCWGVEWNLKLSSVGSWRQLRMFLLWMVAGNRYSEFERN